MSEKVIIATNALLNHSEATTIPQDDNINITIDFSKPKELNNDKLPLEIRYPIDMDGKVIELRLKAYGSIYEYVNDSNKIRKINKNE